MSEIWCDTGILRRFLAYLNGKPPEEPSKTCCCEYFKRTNSKKVFETFCGLLHLWIQETTDLVDVEWDCSSSSTTAKYMETNDITTGKTSLVGHRVPRNDPIRKQLAVFAIVTRVRISGLVAHHEEFWNGISLKPWSKSICFQVQIFRSCWQFVPFEDILRHPRWSSQRMFCDSRRSGETLGATCPNFAP